MATQQFFALKALIEKDGKILLLRESDAYAEGTNVGKYDVPGGRLNAGEKLRDGLQREVSEETGLTVAADGWRPLLLEEWFPHVRGEDWQVIGCFVVCAWQAGEVRLSADHDDYVWAGLSEWQNLPLASHVGEALNAYWGRS